MDDQFVRVPRKRRRRFGGLIINLLTLVVLAAIAGVIGVFGMIFMNPQVGFNPFPPPTLARRGWARQRRPSHLLWRWAQPGHRRRPSP